MPTLDQHQSSEFIKLLYIGDSGTGKTGSLVSLLQAGYSLRILDCDNGLDSLVQFGRAANVDLARVQFETVRDEYKSSKIGPVIKGAPKAFIQAMEILTEWSAVEDPNCFFVLDTLSSLGRSAFEWAKGMNPMAKDPRQWYGTAQKGIEDMLALLSGPGFKMNVIIMSHVNYKEVFEGVSKGYVNAVGTALGPAIPRYFNTLILAESSGSGTNVRRKIKTLPTGVIDLKTPSPKVEADYPLATGLASIVAKLKEQ
jgi:hypothetical protein